MQCPPVVSPAKERQAAALWAKTPVAAPNGQRRGAAPPSTCPTPPAAPHHLAATSASACDGKWKGNGFNEPMRGGDATNGPTPAVVNRTRWYKHTRGAAAHLTARWRPTPPQNSAANTQPTPRPRQPASHLAVIASGWVEGGWEVANGRACHLRC